MQNKNESQFYFHILPHKTPTCQIWKRSWQKILYFAAKFFKAYLIFHSSLQAKYYLQSFLIKKGWKGRCWKSFQSSSFFWQGGTSSDDTSSKMPFNHFVESLIILSEIISSKTSSKITLLKIETHKDDQKSKTTWYFYLLDKV
jgi:hypothetical protein